MGGHQSSLHIYLGKKDGTYDIPDHYNIKISKSYSKEGCNFIRIVYSIKYDHDFKKHILISYDSYNLTLCSGTQVDVGDKIFTFYPQRISHIIKVVTVYYSVLYPKNPLYVIFTTITKKGNFHFLYDNLKSKKYAYSSDLSNLVYREGLKNGLKQEFNKLSHGNKLQIISTPPKKQVDSFNQIIGNGKYIRDLFNSKVKNASVSVSELFLRTPRHFSKNHIDSSYLSIFNGKYDGIIVFLNKDDIALAIEALDDNDTKIHLVKRDKYGTHWEKDTTFKYKKDSQIIPLLDKLAKASSENAIVTYILDRKSGYNDVTVKSSTDDKKYYKYFTHTNAVWYIITKSSLKVGSEKFKPGDKDYEVLFDTIDVYFLKHKGKDDDKPFLMKFRQQQDSKLKIYYSNKVYKSDDWKEFEYSQSVLDKRLEELEQDGNCTKSIDELRDKAFEILSRDKKPAAAASSPSPARPVPQPPPATPPKTSVPPTQPPSTSLDIPLIAGSTAGAVGGTAILGAGGYGYYLYATTIKLLT